jgi:hypothetical protein
LREKGEKKRKEREEKRKRKAEEAVAEPTKKRKFSFRDLPFYSCVVPRLLEQRKIMSQ